MHGIYPVTPLEEGKYKWGVQYHFHTPFYALQTPNDHLTTRHHGGVFGERRLTERWGVRASLDYAQMWHSLNDPEGVNFILQLRRHYGMLSLTPRRYVGEKKRLCVSFGPCVAIPFYATDDRYAKDGPQKSDHVFETMMGDDIVDDPVTYHPPDADRAHSHRVPVHWRDGFFGAKVGIDYAFEHGFLLGIDINMLFPFPGRGVGSFHSHPLCSLSLKLGWDLNALFPDADIAYLF